MTAETISPTIGIYLVSFLTVLFFIWLLVITIKKELVKLKKKRLIREFKILNQEYHNWLDSSTYTKNNSYLMWCILDSNFYTDLIRIKVEYKELNTKKI